MCGIVGYIGNKQAYPILIKGLRRLEYRGYDSAGVALINDNGNLNVCKTKGKVDNLEEYCKDKDVSGTVGIAHTRWATHGEPSAVNAHPHYSESKNLAIIHNGIIENYADLKRKLQSKGVEFRSDTDTEVLVQLVEYIMEHKDVDLLTAVQVALFQVIGAYAIAIIDKRDPNQIIAARKQSPLVVGIGKDEFFLGSDATPLVEYTDKVVYLEDGNIAVSDLIKPYGSVITCVGFMGGDQNIRELHKLVDKLRSMYPHLRFGWYSGRNKWSEHMMEPFDYVKFGSYKKECGGLDSPTTNQVLLKRMSWMRPLICGINAKISSIMLRILKSGI